jgi:ABC-type enterochelin transport system permease subunit
MEAIARRMGNQLPSLVSDVAVDKDVGANFVVVPNIAGRILVKPVMLPESGLHEIKPSV